MQQRQVRVTRLRCAVALALGECATVAATTGRAWAGTPQGPQAITFLVSCPNVAPFLATTPSAPSPIAVGRPMAVIPLGIFKGRMPENLVMSCTLTDVVIGNVIDDVPLLIAPSSH
jgi:hypothetical protein